MNKAVNDIIKHMISFCINITNIFVRMPGSHFTWENQVKRG